MDSSTGLAPFDPLSAVAEKGLTVLLPAAVKDLGDHGGVVTVRSEDVAPAVTRRDADFGWIATSPSGHLPEQVPKRCDDLARTPLHG